MESFVRIFEILNRCSPEVRQAFLDAAEAYYTEHPFIKTKIYTAEKLFTDEVVEGELYYIDEISPFNHQAYIKKDNVHIRVKNRTVKFLEERDVKIPYFPALKK